MRENWLLQKCPLCLLSRKRSDLWKFPIPSFFLKKTERDDHQFLTEKMSTGLRICNRGVRVWSGRFQTFSESFRGDCESCILRNFSGCFFSIQDFFHQDSFKKLRKNLQTFNRLSAWLKKLHPLCPEEQFEWFFWRKSSLTNFFEVWIKIFLNFVEKLWARSWNFLLWVQRYKLRAFFEKI